MRRYESGIERGPGSFRAAGAVLAVTLAACGGSRPYSSPVATPSSTTFNCVRSQLVQMGYTIEDADGDGGTVVGSLEQIAPGGEPTALVLSAAVEPVEDASRLSIEPTRRTVNADGSVDRESDAQAEADARELLVRCGGRIDQGEPDRPYGVRPEITTTP